MKKIFIFVLAAITLLSCAKKEELEDGAVERVPEGCELRTFTVSWDEDTRTALSGTSVVWETGDAIAVFDNLSSTTIRRFTVVSGGGTTAVISGYVTEGATTFAAVYPYSAVEKRNGSNIDVVLPALQRAVPGGADSASLLAVASGTSAGLTFKNVCALMKVTLSRSDVKNVTLTGMGNESLAGHATISPGAAISSVKGPSLGVVLKPAFGNTLAAGTYVIPVLPTTFSNGFYLNVYTASKQLKSVYASSLTLGRNGAKDCGTIDSGNVYDYYYGDNGGTKTSSTLNFYWDLASYADREEAKAMPWRAALYRDSDCSDLVVSFDIPANAKDGDGTAIFGSGEPRFIFSGLDPATQYWFRATSLTTFLSTRVLSTSTTSFLPKPVPSSSVSAGDVILAEDFGELRWFGDRVNVGSAGYIPIANYKAGGTPATAGFPAVSGVNPSPLTFQGIDDEARMFRELRNCLGETRLDGWSEIHENHEPVVCARPGYVKMGAAKHTGSLVTPKLSCIPSGKTATVRVSFKAAHANYAEKSYIKVQAVQGTVGADGTITRSFTPVSYGASYTCEATNNNGWDSFSCELSGLTSEDRIAIGGNRAAAGTTAGNAQLRFMLDEIVITLVSLQTPDVASRLERATSSTITVSWSPSNYSSAAADVAHPYTFGLYTNAACSSPVVEWTSPASASYWNRAVPRFIFSGLTANTTYYFRAKATDTNKQTMAMPVSTTAWTNVQVGDYGSASAGQTILAEDFGQLVWYGDVQDGAVGYVADDFLTATTVKKATGSNPSGFTLKKGSDECRLHNDFAGMLKSINTTRLKDWAEWDEGSAALVCCHAGYVKLGAEKYSCMYITPRLKSIPTEKKAKLRVSFKAARYGSDVALARIGVFHNDMIISDAHKISHPSGTYSDLKTKIAITGSWATYTYEIDGITSSDRIAIGPDRGNSGTTAGTDQLRMLLDEVKIEIVSLSDNNYKVVPLSSTTAGYMKVYNFRNSNNYGMICCMGGGYSTHTQNEVNNTLSQFSSNFTLGVVYYTLPAGGTKRDAMLAEMATAVTQMKNNKSSWGGYSKLGITGCSAGGHLCAIVAQRNKGSLDFQAPQFAVITMVRANTHAGSVDQLLGSSPSASLINEFSAEKHVTADMPPAYIAYSTNDTVVPYSTNSLAYVNACAAAGAKYKDNPHSSGGHSNSSWSDWPSAFITWLGTL